MILPFFSGLHVDRLLRKDGTAEGDVLAKGGGMPDRNSQRIGPARPRIWAVVAMVSGVAVLSAGAFTVGRQGDLPHGMPAQAEAPRTETHEIRSRTVHTVAVGPDGSETPGRAERTQVFVQGRPVAQADIDRARANLEQGLRELRSKPAGGPGPDFDAGRWTGSVAEQSEPPRDAPRDGARAEARTAPPQQTAPAAAKPSKPDPTAGAGPGDTRAGPRVTIHWPKQDGTSAKLAKDIAREFKENGWTVAALQPVATSVRRAEVRHPGGNARSEADRLKSELANWLAAEGHSDRVALSRRKTEENAIEVWLPKSSNLGRAPVQGHRTKRKPKSNKH
jgi:hypothetical protein